MTIGTQLAIAIGDDMTDEEFAAYKQKVADASSPILNERDTSEDVCGSCGESAETKTCISCLGEYCAECTNEHECEWNDSI